MLLNVSYNNKAISQKINKEVGRSFPLKTRWVMRGIGSPKLSILKSSVQISNLLILDNNLNTCQIELRPKGILVSFRSLLETYALVIPYYKLSLYKGDAMSYTIYKDEYYLKVLGNTKAIQDFFKKIVTLKADALPTSIEDL
jgi:hypothetical protein